MVTVYWCPAGRACEILLAACAVVAREILNGKDIYRVLYWIEIMSQDKINDMLIENDTC